MPEIRRVITGFDSDGMSCIVADSAAARYRDSAARPGLRVTSLWEGQVPPTTTTTDPDPADEVAFVPPPGNARMMHVLFPPDGPSQSRSESPQTAAAGSATDDGSDHVDESRGPRMHATETVEVLMIVAGQIDMILEADRTTLRAGDVVVQSGTWHTWANPYDEPCEMFGVNLSI
jgi:mannose-6-phosphate isomerase-like protein (cupin superfamily)